MLLATLMWITQILVSGLLVSMVFFAALVAPSVFAFLDKEASGRFLRGFFPRYYIFGIVVALPAAILLTQLQRPVESFVLLGVAGLFLLSRQVLTPRINDARDGAMAGDETSAHRFETLHKVSVGINLAQMLALVFVLVRVGPFQI